MRNNDQSLNTDTFLLFKNTRMKLFIFIPVLFFSSVLLANFDYVEKTTCYAEHNSTTYIDGLCDLYFDKTESYQFTLSHKIECDDGNCGFSFQIYNYDDLDIWSVNFSSDFNKRSQKMQEYLGNEYKISISEENTEKRICAVNENSRFCFNVSSNIGNDTFLKQLDEIG